MKRRILSIVTALALCLSSCPTWALAFEGEPDTGLCAHHPIHTEDCGYIGPVEGRDCGHVHTDECSTEETLCVHVHDASCYSDGELPAEGEDKAADTCAHVCTVDSGCVTLTLDCQHTHDIECGYIQADPGQPCGYDCKLCPIEALIAALPGAVTADNRAEVEAQLQEILDLWRELSEDEQEQLDLTLCYELLAELDSANAPAPAAEQVSADYREASWNNGAVTYTTKTANNCTPVEISTDAITWNEGWYVVTGTVTISQPITVSGDVKLILADDCELNAEQGIVVTSGNSLTIYAQAGGTGKLNATGVADTDTDNVSAGIGGGTVIFDSGTITIHGGVIHATGGSTGLGIGGAGIGGGSVYSGNGGNSGAITIFGGTVTAESGVGDITGAGIGGGTSNNGGAGSNITIYGGKVTAASTGTQAGGAGIGGGAGNITGGVGNDITIYGGIVTATGGSLGAGIGGGGSGGTSGAGTCIAINGGEVTAEGGRFAAGIGGGGGYFSYPGGTGTGISITSGIVDAKGGAGNSSGNYKGDPIGNGGNASGDADVTKTAGIIFENGVGKVYGTVTLDENYAVPADYSLTIQAGASLSGSGKLSGGGDYLIEGLTADMISVPEGWSYTGEDLTEQIKGVVSLSGDAIICGQTFHADTTGWELSVTKVSDLKYTVTYTHTDELPVSKDVLIAQAQTTLSGVSAYKADGTTPASTFGADETFIVKAKIDIPENAIMTAADFTAPTEKQMALFVGDAQVSAPVSAGEDGTYTMTASASDVLTLGQKEPNGDPITLTAKFVGNGNMADASATVEVNISASVKVEIGDATTYYGGINAALAAAGAAESATVTLLDHVTASSQLLVLNGNVTFDGGEFTLTRSPNNNSIFNINGGKLTVIGGTLKTGEYTSGTPTCIVVGDGELVVTGGSLEAGTGCVGLVAFPNAMVKLSGGTFHGILMSGDANTVGRLLLNYGSTNAADKHYAYYQGSQPVNLTTLDNPARLTGTVTVGECEHTGVKPTPNGDGTHSLKCPYCGYKGTAEKCAYTFSENVGTCTCGDKLTVEVDSAPLTYNGTEQEPGVTVKRGEQELTAGTNYTVAYANNKNAGDTASVTVTIGSNQGTYTKTFSIGKATPTIAWSGTSQELTYTGQPAVITAPDVTLENGEQFGGTISYSYAVGESTSYTSGLPTNAGTYTIKASVAAEGNYAAAESTNTLTLTIKQAKVTITWGSNATQTITYTGKAAEITAPTVSAENGLTVSVNPEYSYAEGDSTSFTPGLPTNAGTYTVRASIKASDNLTAAEADMTLMISKVTLTISGATVDTKTYDGNAQAAVSGVTFSGLVNGETLELGTDYTATGAFDTASAGENKNVTVTVALKNTTKANNYTLSSGTVAATGKIEKANSTITAAPTATGITYGQALSDSTLSGGEGSVEGTFTWTDGTEKPNAGTAQYSVTFTPDDATNYNTATANVSVAVAKATPDLTAPTASAIEYGQKLSASTLNGGNAVNPNGNTAVVGKWSWASADTQPTATGTFAATFTPTDTANYDTPENVNVSVTVNPAMPKITLTVPSHQKDGQSVAISCTVENSHDATKDDLPTVTLTYTIRGETKTVEGTSFIIPAGTAVDTVITITATTADVTGKYTAATKTATVTVTDKTPVTISGAKAENATYDGKTHNGYTGTLAAGAYNGSFACTYTGRNGTAYNSSTPPTNAGDYTVTITLADNTEYIGSLSLDFTIGKASITIMADNKQADVGTAKPALTYTVDGLADGDTLSTAPTLTCDPDMNTVGSYPITASGAAVPSGGNYNAEITYVPGTLTVTDPTIHVTSVTLNKDTLTLTVGGSERLTATVAPGDATDKSVTWTSSNTAVATVDASGNVKAVSAGTATITLTTADGSRTATCTVTVRTSDGGGGYVPSTPSTPTSTVTVPVSGDKNTVRVSASVSGSTATVSKIDTTQIDSVIGGSAQTSMVEIDFTGLGKTIDTVKLPTDAIAEIAAAARDKNVGGLTIKLSNSEISFNGDALAAIQTQAGSQITLTVTPAKASDLNTRQKETVGSAPVYDLTLQSNGRIITDFRGGYATVSLPYTLAAGQNPSGVVVYYLDSNGNITPCTTIYDVRNQSAIFTTSHLSLYFVGYDPAAVWVNPFSDVAESAWYYDAVRFVNQNGLMNGYSNGSFGPNDYLSRAMLAQILYNRAGKPTVTGGSIFTDVASGQWYTNAVIWANQNGIVGGYGNGLFGPNDNITREQLAVMLWRYAGSPAATDKELHFTDAGEAGSYALEALRWAVENGVINGYGDGRLGPKGLATRAQVAQMLMNFLSK